MTTPSWSRDLAVQQANGPAEALRRRGWRTKLFVEGSVGDVPSRRWEGNLLGSLGGSNPTGLSCGATDRPAVRVRGANHNAF